MRFNCCSCVQLFLGLVCFWLKLPPVLHGIQYACWYRVSEPPGPMYTYMHNDCKIRLALMCILCTPTPCNAIGLISQKIVIYKIRPEQKKPDDMHFYEINFLFISFYWFKFLEKHCYCFQSVYYVFIFDVFNLKTEHILYENVPGCVIVRCQSPKRNNMYYAHDKKLCLSYFRSCCPGWFVHSPSCKYTYPVQIR